MKIKITPSMARKYSYQNPCGCPLYHALKAAGVDVRTVLTDEIFVGDPCGIYHFYKPDWNSRVYNKLAKSKRSLWLDIPGLKVGK